MSTFSQVKKEAKMLDSILDGAAQRDNREVEEFESIYGKDLKAIGIGRKHNYKHKEVTNI